MSSLCAIDGLISPWESLISRMLKVCFRTLRHILIDIPEKISEAREETNRFYSFTINWLICTSSLALY